MKNHFFGVFNFLGDEWDFESLPSHYRDSVFITLDTGHVGVGSKLDEALSNNDNVGKVEGGRQNSITVHSKLPLRRRWKRATGFK